MNDVNQTNPYRTPEADLMRDSDLGTVRYAGFWIRVLAAIIDSIIILAVTFPLLYAVYGQAALSSEEFVQGPAEILISYVLPMVFTIALWIKFGGTPGKRILGLKVLDEKTHQHLALGGSVLRYIGYFASMIVLFLGIIWVAFDKKKKGWHDHIAGTIVIKE